MHIMPASPIFDHLRTLVAKTDALSHAAEYELDNLIDPDRRGLERVGHLVSATSEAATAALEAIDQLRATSALR